jgi:hypothetical protein
LEKGQTVQRQGGAVQIDSDALDKKLVEAYAKTDTQGNIKALLIVISDRLRHDQ